MLLFRTIGVNDSVRGWKRDSKESCASGDPVVVTMEGLDQISHWVVEYKNRFFHRGGYIPVQPVFGKNPRLPHEILSDEVKDVVGLQTLDEDLRLQDAIS